MRLPVAPNRQLGQHFLVDENILGVIGRLAELDADDVVLEVGPGLGVLTAYLAERVARVHAVELDRALEPHLAERLRGRENVDLTFGDALRLDLAALEPAPRRSSSRTCRTTSRRRSIVESLDGLPSVEPLDASWCSARSPTASSRGPARRPTARSRCSCSSRPSARASIPVSRTVFRPPPNVDSALVAFRRTALPEDFAAIKNVVEAAFAHRRKTLPNSVELAGLARAARAAEALARSTATPRVRAEALEPHEFVALTAAMR